MRSRGQKAEKAVLKKIKARPQPASGSLPGMPNDGTKGKYLIEVKSTVKKSISIKREWLESLDENALLRGKTGALILVWDEKSEGIPIPYDLWVAIPLGAFERLTNDWKK